MASSELRPLLKLVPTGKVRFHEHPEGRRTARLMERIARDAQLRNPPIVADMGNGHFLLLDGANRVSAFRDLNYPLVPVQVVDYGDHQVQLKGWHHLLLQGASLSLREAYDRLEGVEMRPVAPGQLARLLELRQVFVVLVEEQDQFWGLFPTSGGDIDINHRIAILESVVSAYEGQTRLERVKLADYDQLPEVIESVQHQVCLFPVLHKEEMLHLANAGVMIPTGLTRHIIPGRALGINLDLSLITGPGSVAEKEAAFQAFVDKISMEGRIRFYEESVFIMNE